MDENARNIVITGAAGGLGTALAVACAERGAQVLLIDKDLPGLEEVCDLIEAGQGAAPGYCQLDMSTAGPESIEELINGFVSTYGDIDGLAHCAVQFEGLSPLDQLPGNSWLSHMQVNLNVAWLMTVSCLSSLRKGDGGNIVFILEDESRSTNAFWGAYGVSKAAVRSLAAIFSEELEGSACRVFGVDPGAMRTDLRATAYLAEDPESHPLPKHAANHIAALLHGEDAGQPALHRVPEG